MQGVEMRLGRKRRVPIPWEVEKRRDISPQRKLQIAWKRKGRCIRCGDPRPGELKEYCLSCMVKRREEQREYLEWRTGKKATRTHNSKAKLLEMEAILAEIEKRKI
jgi:hypothetical protein